MATKRRLALLRLDARCSCGAPAPVRIPPSERLRHLGDPPGRPVLYVQCRRHRCGKVYAIRAKAYQQARPEAA